MVRYVFEMLLQLEFGELTRRGLPRSREAGEKVGQTLCEQYWCPLLESWQGTETRSWIGGTLKN